MSGRSAAHFIIAGTLLLLLCTYEPSIALNSDLNSNTYPELHSLLQTERWESIGPDGGDMHFVYISSNHTVFASHGFGGFWRSWDGENWKLVYNPEFVNMNIFAMAEINGTLLAGGNKGLWKSYDDGKTWSKVYTGYDDIDNGHKYEIVSIIPFSENHIFFSVKIDKGALREGFTDEKNGFFELNNGTVTFWEIPDSATPYVVTMLGYDDDLNGREVLFVSSSDSGLYIFDLTSKNWYRILDKFTTRVFVDAANDTVYVGTIGDWYYIGKYDANTETWNWEHVTIPGEICAVAEFIVRDPYNPNRVWIGASGGERGSLYDTDISGVSFVGVGFWIDGEWKDLKVKGNWGTTIAIDRHQKGERVENYTITTPYGLGARIAYVPQGGAGCIQKTEDGGASWRRAYSGIYGDTINKINYINYGVRNGDIAVTCVSGTQITKDFGNSWEEGIDFTIGDVGFGLPGYSWGVASPPSELEGKYDLLVATGYPPTTFTGNGIYAVDTDCLKSGYGACMKRIASGPYFDLVVVDEKLFAGRMDEDLDIIDLNDYSVQKVDVDGAGINVAYIDGKLFISTERGGNRDTDSYFFSDPRCEGSLYVCNIGVNSVNCQKIYDGDRIVSFSVNGSKIIALTNSNRVIYWENYNYAPSAEVNLRSATYSDMVVDWKRELIYLSTFDAGDSGVYITNLDKIFEGKMYGLSNGLLERRIRDLILVDEYLFAGTEGMSVWRLKIPENFKPVAEFSGPSNPIAGKDLTFNASSSFDIDGIITTFIWDFGDGSVVTTTQPSITHTFQHAGMFNVSLTVVDEGGLSNTTSMILEVSEILLGDVDGNNVINFNDLIGVLNLILAGAYDPAADVDGNNIVNFNDLIAVLNAILTSG